MNAKFEVIKQVDVTAMISSKDRYYTTLPLAMTAIANQSVKPKYFILYLDGEHIDLRDDPIYKYIFKMFDTYNIQWEVMYAPHRGQAFNHHHIWENAKTDLVWRVDDDDVPEYDVLYELYEFISKSKNVGAVGGLVLLPDNYVKYDVNNMNYDGVIHVGNDKFSSKIKNIFSTLNLQWGIPSSVIPIEVDHLYNSFLYSRKASKDGFPTNLSPVGHREETIFTHNIKRNGYELYILPHIITWHYRQFTGGIQDAAKNEEFRQWWDYDEMNFQNIYEKEWGYKFVENTESKIIMLDSGIGDHFAFKSVINNIKNFHGKLDIYACYPNVFYDNNDPNIVIHNLSEYNFPMHKDTFNVYLWMGLNNWTESLTKAYETMYTTGG